MVNWGQSEDDYWEVLPSGVSRGAGLTVLMILLGLAPAEAVASGDHLNDREMLAVAGLGVAVQKNTHPGLKTVARRITRQPSWQGVLEVLAAWPL